MNTQNQNHNGTIDSQIATALPPGSTIQQFNDLTRARRVPRRLTGKVAQLPHHIPIQVNQWLYDGVTYRKICANLEQLGLPRLLSPEHPALDQARLPGMA